MTNTIMIFAAGQGTRMYPLTDKTPKPLIKIADRPILHWMLDLVLTYPFKQIIINTHHLSEQVRDSAENYFKNGNVVVDNFATKYGILPQLIISHETEILETAGGLKNNLQYLGDEETIFTCNSDVIISCNRNPFQLMLQNWQPAKMDMMMLVHETAKAVGYKGRGDFFRNDLGFISCDKGADMPYMHTGILLMKTAIIAQQREKILSLSEYFPDKKYSQNICSVVNEGHWCHATSPQDIASIEAYVKQHQLSNKTNIDFAGSR